MRGERLAVLAGGLGFAAADVVLREQASRPVVVEVLAAAARVADRDEVAGAREEVAPVPHGRAAAARVGVGVEAREAASERVVVEGADEGAAADGCAIADRGGRGLGAGHARRDAVGAVGREESVVLGPDHARAEVVRLVEHLIVDALVAVHARAGRGALKDHGVRGDAAVAVQTEVERVARDRLERAVGDARDGAVALGGLDRATEGVVPRAREVGGGERDGLGGARGGAREPGVVVPARRGAARRTRDRGHVGPLRPRHPRREAVGDSRSVPLAGQLWELLWDSGRRRRRRPVRGFSNRP